MLCSKKPLKATPKMEHYNIKNGKNKALKLINSSKIDVVEGYFRSDSFPFLESILYIASMYH